MDNTIRRICIGADPKNQFVYFIGGEHKIYIDGKPRVVIVSEILKTKKHILIYINSGNETQLWKELPRNDSTTIEFIVD